MILAIVLSTSTKTITKKLEKILKILILVYQLSGDAAYIGDRLYCDFSLQLFVVCIAFFFFDILFVYILAVTIARLLHQQMFFSRGKSAFAECAVFCIAVGR